MRLLLRDKTLAILWLAENFHERRFFGNALERMYLLLKDLRPCLVRERKPERVQRKRGYQDHGSLRPLHCWKETHAPEFTEEQNEIERLRKVNQDLTDLLEGWLQ
jgi:hypothetical protein